MNKPGRIDLNAYGRIESYYPRFGRWGGFISGTLVAGALCGVAIVYLHLRSQLGEIKFPLMEFELPLGIFAFLVLTLFVVTALFKPPHVIIFQEGIYVHHTRSAITDPSRTPSFIPWNEITKIIRTPHRGMRMSIIGAKPTDEVIVSDSLRPYLDEIQDRILTMASVRKLEIINLGDGLHNPIGYFGSPYQDLTGLAPILVFAVPLLKTVGSDISIAMSVIKSNPVYLLLPMISGGGLAAVVGLIVYTVKIGVYGLRITVYREGMLISKGPSGAFARWEEIQSVERVKSGTFQINSVDTNIRPSLLNIGKSRGDEFERVIKRLGVTVV